MITAHRLVLALSLSCCLLSMQAVADAPVIDESENFAMLEDQQDPMNQPVSRVHQDTYDNDEEQALAHESSSPTSSNNDASLINKIQGLQQEVQELRGQLEVQAHDLNVLKEQQLAFYKDLDARLASGANKTTALSSGPTAINVPAPVAKIQPSVKAPTESLSSGTKAKTSMETPTPTSPPKVVPVSASAQHNPADEQISYLAAYELIKNKKYDDALSSMQTFVNHYPKSGFTANAQYWLGELYMVKKQYPEAINHFEAVVQNYPASSKSAASMLKIGYALAASGKHEEAKQRLQQVVKTYPDTNTAQLATAKLESFDS